jgi:hypothetical protein
VFCGKQLRVREITILIRKAADVDGLHEWQAYVRSTRRASFVDGQERAELCKKLVEYIACLLICRIG